MRSREFFTLFSLWRVTSVFCTPDVVNVSVNCGGYHGGSSSLL